jgi:hypothetical protein
MTHRYYYAVYGLRLVSNVPLPGLPVQTAQQVDVEVDFAGGVTEREETTGAVLLCRHGVETLWRTSDGAWLVRLTGVRRNTVEFLLAADGARIHVSWTPGVAIQNLPPLVQNMALGACLLRRGVLSLHASAVLAPHGALLILGASGNGKSSTTAALLARACRLLTDDIAALDIRADHVWVQPGYPGIRLWPDTAAALGFAPEALPTVFRNTSVVGDKRFLDVHHIPGAFHPAPAPVQAIYILGARRADLDTPLLAPLSTKQAIPHLMANIYGAYRLDASMYAWALPQCIRLAQVCRIVSVIPTARLTALPGLAQALLSDVG